ncbi:hypothetical protein IY145_02325 [Methylosinus sp. H3A]|uniref:hypothetical protein n=1 Tax=Methylosinus sp. H3A TaxID=2785786 RepID=UPI0018C24F90|nr:hypothetical protein [Methylosinus sp. H3A]MBG0808225.1 hypothetical protein [Methylosinus sp. H3A]
MADQSIVVHNLARILAAGDGAAFDGVSATRWAEEGERGLVLDLHFFGASLGDDIGVVGAAADACYAAFDLENAFMFSFAQIDASTPAGRSPSMRNSTPSS